MSDQATSRASAPATGMATVTVACKLPHGLILRIFKMVSKTEPMMGGGVREAAEAMEIDRFVVNGWSHPQNAAPTHQIASGAAITPGVPRELWNTWLAQNKDSDIVRNGLIWAHERDQNVIAEAKEKLAVKSGLERLDPNKLPKGIKTAEARA